MINSEVTAPRPLTPAALADRLAGLAAERRLGHPLRVALDGAPAAGADRLAGDIAERLPALGRPPVRISTRWFLRAASLRLERGRTDPDSYYDGWLDVAALRREVLDPAGPGGSGRILPALLDPDTDRATRAPYEQIDPAAVVLVDGPLLLGSGLPFDLTVHLRLSAAALERLTPEVERWTLPAYERYEREVDPEAAADVVVRADHPDRPALVLPSPR